MSGGLRIMSQSSSTYARDMMVQNLMEFELFMSPLETTMMSHGKEEKTLLRKAVRRLKRRDPR